MDTETLSTLKHTPVIINRYGNIFVSGFVYLRFELNISPGAMITTLALQGGPSENGGFNLRVRFSNPNYVSQGT